jgi:hypothetical protein
VILAVALTFTWRFLQLRPTTSSVGNSQVYEAGDQKTVPNSQIEQEKKDNRFHEGKENSHKANDSSKGSSWSVILKLV